MDRNTIKKVVLISIIVSLLAPIGILQTTAASSANLLQNSGFETGIVPWTLANTQGYAGTLTQTTDSYQGTYSGQFTVTAFPGTGYIVTSQTIQPEIGNTYTLQFFYKSTMKVIPRVFCFDDSWQTIQFYTGPTSSPTNTWSQTTMTFGPIPQGTVHTQIHFVAVSTGKFQIDNAAVQLQATAASSANLLQNSGFETGIVPWTLANTQGYAGTLTQTTDSYQGTYSGQFTVTAFPGTGYIVTSQTIQPEIGNTYTLQFFYKSTMKVIPRVFCFDDSWQTIQFYTGPTSSPTNTWSQTTMTFGPIPQGTVHTQIHFVAVSTGKFQIDNAAVQLQATQTQTPTPSPTLPSQNLASIPSGWDLTYSNSPQIIFLDTTVTRSGSPSIRIERHTSADVNTAREVDSGFYKVSPGDHVIASVWVRTEPSQLGDTSSHAGGRIGMSLWYTDDPPNWGTENYLLWDIVENTYYNPHNTASVQAQYVPWGTSTWTKRTIDFVVPDTYFTTDVLSGQTISPVKPNVICMWMQGWSSTYAAADPARVWFADAELYINP